MIASMHNATQAVQSEEEGEGLRLGERDPFDQSSAALEQYHFGPIFVLVAILFFTAIGLLLT